METQWEEGYETKGEQYLEKLNVGINKKNRTQKADKRQN